MGYLLYARRFLRSCGPHSKSVKWVVIPLFPFDGTGSEVNSLVSGPTDQRWHRSVKQA